MLVLVRVKTLVGSVDLVVSQIPPIITKCLWQTKNWPPKFIYP